ncbi:MAG: class I SAM-dependent methyltransferase [Bdellovibrionia bacterium]
MTIDILSYNREAWNRKVTQGNEWTKAVSTEEVDQARQGNWKIVLTPLKPVPRDWFPNLKGTKVLGLASGGGQQGPILAAAGAEVTVFDNSPAQLAQDAQVAARDGLSIKTVQGDMKDLSSFEDESFDLIVHPCSNCFVPDVKPVWKEAYRVLKNGGTLISGFTYPIVFTLDPELEAKGIFQIKYKIPYSDLDLTEEERKRYTDKGEPLAFGHTLEDQIGGQIAAGFSITGFYEDKWSPDKSPLSALMSCFGATRALKS